MVVLLSADIRKNNWSKRKYLTLCLQKYTDIVTLMDIVLKCLSRHTVCIFYGDIILIFYTVQSDVLKAGYTQ